MNNERTTRKIALENELAAIKLEEIQEENAKRQTRANFILANIDNLLTFADKHGRTSCSDENPCNIERCTRCDLLNAKENGYWFPDYDIVVTIQKYPCT